MGKFGAQIQLLQLKNFKCMILVSSKTLLVNPCILESKGDALNMTESCF